jgi:hypothetical protein
MLVKYIIIFQEVNIVNITATMCGAYLLLLIGTFLMALVIMWILVPETPPMIAAVNPIVALMYYKL